ncbi:hypothetical protein [Thermoactinomyces mirandus]|uniref:Uncharacterized protein n=1 Tax=Thermoactinomyces mirandus TaxID=2756294 RepID=A0A7W1XR62_9BACL|nr:hypothetical protein [Thermoactinomyces mirandus]MBA4601540.1 hypothetical protein [Thermoactinomyces mirandus]
MDDCLPFAYQQPTQGYIALVGSPNNGFFSCIRTQLNQETENKLGNLKTKIDLKYRRNNHPNKPSNLQAGVKNFSVEFIDDPDGGKICIPNDKREPFHVRYSEYAGEQKTKTTSLGRTYSVK